MSLFAMLAPWVAKGRSACQKLVWLPPLVTRITLGDVFLLSGWGKSHNLEQVTNYFRELGIPAAELQAPFVAGLELVGGSLLLLGLCTRAIAIPLCGTMVVAILTARKAELGAVDDLFGFIEYLYIVLLMWLVIQGPGSVAVDRWLFKRQGQK